jgi:hypothetical protein
VFSLFYQISRLWDVFIYVMNYGSLL